MDEDKQLDVSAFAELFNKQTTNRACRRYELKQIDGRLMLVRDEFDRLFESTLSEVFGTELEPDDKDGMFLD